MEKEKQINVQIECIIKDINLLQPTKQFKNSVKETYNAKLVISHDDANQIDDLNKALNDAVQNGKKQFNWDDKTKIVYPTKHEQNGIVMVACTFFKPKIIDIHKAPLNDEQIQEIEKMGQFYGIVDLSFYPYAKFNNGIGTNLNAVMFIGYNKPITNEILPFDTKKDIEQKQNIIKEQKENMKQENNQTPNTKTNALNHIKEVALTHKNGGIEYTYSFDLFKGTNESKYTVYVVQEKSQPTKYNIAVYNPKLFLYDTLLLIIKEIEKQLNNGTLWANAEMPKSIISQNYKWAKMQFIIDEKEQNIN